jgi:isochorismate synthase EntC
MNNKILDDFLDCGYFIGIPSENKIWCMASSHQTYSSSQNLKPPYFYLNDFYMSKNEPFCKGEIFFELSYFNLLEMILKEKSEKPNIKWDELEKDIYITQFDSLKMEIEKNFLKKGVPYSYLKGNAEIKRENKIYLMKKILENKNQSSSYIYGYWNKNEGFIGSTPELLFIQKNKIVHTIALAGTIPNEPKAKKEEFLLDTKMQKEHFFVVEGLKLSLFKFGKVVIGDTKLLELPKLIHLKTDIQIELLSNDKFKFENFLIEIHPTAAVGTLPKNPQSNWLAQSENEISKRGYYAAPFGVVLDENNSICICTIRGMQWNGSSLKICAGGGVIHESEFSMEWEEIISKINAIKYSLGV